MRTSVVATGLLLLISAATTRTATAETLEVLGQAGMLGEWELTASITPTGARREFSGQMVMKHVGICAQDGPLIKTGEIQLQRISWLRVRATLVVDGVTCTYEGRKSDSFYGPMRCPDKRDVPLLMWLK